MSRRTYDAFARDWPKITDPGDPFTERMNSLPKYVVSTSLGEAGDAMIPEGESPDPTAVGAAWHQEIMARFAVYAVDRRGRGVGTALVDNFIAEGRAMDACHLHLEVRDGNSAHGLYQRAGFRLVGRRSKYYRGTDGQQFDALTMALDI